MAVTAENLGQQVRCPHCQQVVLAPATAADGPASEPAPAPADPPPTPETGSSLSPAEEKESIFTPDEQASEDLFGAVPRPLLELPPPLPPALPPPPASPPLLTEEPYPASQPPPPLPSAPLPEPACPFAEMSTPALAEATAPAPWESAPASDGASLAPAQEASPWSESSANLASAELPADFDSPPPLRVAARRSGNWLIVAFIVPLISYSILMTILAVMFYFRLRAQEHPLELLPDVEGDNVGARRLAVYDRIKPDTPLPDKLRVALGEPIRVGDLEVTPLRVEQARIRLRYPDGREEGPQREESLVLHLQLRNVSENVAFKPTDPAFLRAWDERKQVAGMPYTYLQAGPQRFCGGPIHWRAGNPPGHRADCYVEGQNEDRELRPGEVMNTLVCTHPAQRAGIQLRNYRGPLLWRVQLRRGLVQVKDREVSATAVIGVEFRSADIQLPRS